MNDQRTNTGRTALITGATSGIGLRLTRYFAQDGYMLVLVARDANRLELVAKELSQKYSIAITTIPKDLSLPSAPSDIVCELREKSIHVDILVNYAGFSEYGPFSGTAIEKELQMIQVNIVSLTHLTKLLLPAMLERNCGKILNVGSTGSFAPGPLNAVYCATKAYVLSFSEAIAEELVNTGISITVLCPGATKTEFAQRAKIENTRLFQQNLMDADNVAKIGYKALMRGKRIAVAGCANQLLVTSLRFTPRCIVSKISKQLMTKTKDGN